MSLEGVFLRMVYPPTSPKIDEILMIQPRSPDSDFSCLSIWAMVYLLVRKIDLRLTAIVKSHHSSGVSWILHGFLPASTEIPALFTSTSIRPNCITALVTSLLTASALLTSVSTKIAWPPFDLINSSVLMTSSPLTSARAFWWRSAQTRCAPS